MALQPNMMLKSIAEETKNFKYVQGDELRSVFGAAFQNLSDRFLKLETHTYYPVDEGESLQKYRGGDIDQSRAALESEFESQSPRSNIEQVRLRLVSDPPSEYERWQLDVAYEIIERTGENIIAIEKTVDDLERFDFIILDDDFIIVQDFDENGHFVGGWITYSKDEIEKFLSEFYHLAKYARPYKELRSFIGNE